MTHQTDHPDQHPQEDPMTTDPTAIHHAQILDWLSAALTDESIHEIRLYQDTSSLSALGDWDVVVHKDVDPAKEVAAQSQADLDTLYRLDGAYKPPAWVADVLKNAPDPEPAMTDDQKRRFLPGFSGTSDPEEEEGEDPQPYDFGGIRPEGYMGCTCSDCLALEKAVRGANSSALKALDEILKPTTTEVPPAFRPEKPLKMKDGGSMTDYLKRRYGKADPAAWWANIGRLDPDTKVTNDSATPVDWDAILSGGRWTTTDYGQRLEATFSGKAAEDLLLALYGFAGDDEAGVAYRADTPESIQKAKDDLFRPEDES